MQNEKKRENEFYNSGRATVGDNGLLTRMFRSLGPLTLRWRMQTTNEEAVVHGLTLREELPGIVQVTVVNMERS